MRILGLDMGDRRIGMAVSDPMGWTAQGLGTLERSVPEHDCKNICEVVKQYEADKIVIGLPKNMDGSVGAQGEKAIQFGETLKERFSGEIIYWDERLTTVSAHKFMLEDNLSRKKRKKSVDRLAAILILQGYLDYASNKKREG